MRNRKRELETEIANKEKQIELLGKNQEDRDYDILEIRNTMRKLESAIASQQEKLDRAQRREAYLKSLHAEHCDD